MPDHPLPPAPDRQVLKLASRGPVVDRHTDLLGEATATFSPDRVYRYALTRRWADGPLTAFVMLNPSTADAAVNDATIRRCIGFARRWETGGLLVVNLFGLRSTHPSDLRGHPDPVGPDNDTVVAAALGGGAVDHVVAGWGTAGDLRDRRRAMAALLDTLGLPMMCLGVTQAGHPRHPLYVAGATPLVPLGGV